MATTPLQRYAKDVVWEVQLPHTNLLAGAADQSVVTVDYAGASNVAPVLNPGFVYSSSDTNVIATDLPGPVRGVCRQRFDRHFAVRRKGQNDGVEGLAVFGLRETDVRFGVRLDPSATQIVAAPTVRSGGWGRN